MLIYTDFSYKLAVGAAAPSVVRLNVAFKAANDFKKYGLLLLFVCYY